jgi:hypothetical protein
MSFDDIQNAWQSPGNRPTSAELEQQRLTMVQALRREHRGLYLRLGLALVWFGSILIAFLRYILSGGAFSLSREWASLVLLTLPLMAAVLFIRRQLRHHREHPGYEQSVSRSVRAMLDAIHAAQQRGRILLGLFVLSVPLLAVCIWQLQLVGKARPQEAASMAVMMAVVIAASGGGIYWHYRGLRPKERQLTALLAELE